MFSYINLAIAAGIMGFALLIKHFFSETIEEEKPFQWLIAGFLLAYIAAAVTMSFFNPLDEIKPLFAAQNNQEIQETTVKL